MRNNENNITFNVRNITLYLENIKHHLTEKTKIITLVSIIIMLGYTNITFTSALSYQSSVGVGFTFNPTLSVSISPSNLVIDNLTPGTTGDSNTINVLVATNAAYGYTLSAIMNGNNNNLTHTNGTNTFSSIATNSSLSNLTTDNTWGYSYKNNLASSPTWSSYSGLSNSADKILFNTDSNSSGSIDFKIAAKASETQPSGTYTGTINFTATTKPMPKTIQDIAYMQTFAELDTTDLASVKSSMTLNSAYILKDIRDEKEYYVTRLEDGNVWMTQNLDLNLSHDKPLTSNDTDLNDNTSAAYQDGYTVESGVLYWTPASTANTINFEGTNVDDWVESNTEPYSANKTDSTETGHASLGNYYNWTAAIASNSSSSIYNNANPANSICPKGWRLPTLSSAESGEFKTLISAYDKSSIKITDAPLSFVASGDVDRKSLLNCGTHGFYWYSSVIESRRYALGFGNDIVAPISHNRQNFGFAVRCLAR